MSAYLKFFELEQSPFEGKAQSQVVLGTRALREAFATIQKGLYDSASRIVVDGERGLGKTSLARALPKLLGPDFRIALVRDPSVAWESLRGSLAKQWGLENGALARSKLVAASGECQLVLVIDQAERATQDFLDHLDVLLSYRSETDRPIVQSVLLARLRCDQGEDPGPLIWWLDRIQTLQLAFAPLTRDGIEPYIQKHLRRAGWRGGQLFSLEAALAIHEYTSGIPGQVSSLCEKLLSRAAEKKRLTIDAAFVHSECDSATEEEEPWTLEDEFEDLVLEEEFARSDGETNDASESSDDTSRVSEPSPGPTGTPSLAEALEHFGGLAEAWDDSEGQAPASEEIDSDSVLVLTETVPACEVESEQASSPNDSDFDASSPLDAATDEPWTMPPAAAYGDDPLDALPSEEELCAIRGSWITRLARPLLAAALAALLGGIAIGQLTSRQDPAASAHSEARIRVEGGFVPRAPQAGEAAPHPVAIESSSDAEPIVLLRAGSGFVSPDSISDAQRQKKTAALTPQQDSEAERVDPEAPARPASPATSPAPGFGWDDLR